jgi:hypothetical protein
VPGPARVERRSGLVIGRAWRRRFKTVFRPAVVAASHIGVPERRETSHRSPSSHGQREGRQSGLRCGVAESRCLCGRLIRLACILVDTWATRGLTAFSSSHTGLLNGVARGAVSLPMPVPLSRQHDGSFPGPAALTRGRLRIDDSSPTRGARNSLVIRIPGRLNSHAVPGFQRLEAQSRHPSDGAGVTSSFLRYLLHTLRF